MCLLRQLSVSIGFCACRRLRDALRYQSASINEHSEALPSKPFEEIRSLQLKATSQSAIYWRSGKLSTQPNLFLTLVKEIIQNPMDFPTLISVKSLWVSIRSLCISVDMDIHKIPVDVCRYGYP